MKTLLSTTALILGLGLPAMLTAQTATDAPDTTMTTPAADMPGFLASRGETDVYASELIGMDVYARRSPTTGTDATGEVVGDGTVTTGTAATGSGTGTTGSATTDTMTATSGSMATMTAADLDTMDNIGQINDIVLSPEGDVRAIVIGVGGFLGMGERDVAVTMDQVSFAADAEDRTERYVFVNTNAEMLRTSPAYERGAMNGTDSGAMATGTTTAAGTDAATGTGMETAPANREVFVAPTVEREGYTQLPVADVSTEMLVGKEVYGVNDESVGNIDDLLLDGQGAITNVIIDFGGFLGLGTTQVSVGYDELTVLADEGRSDVRVYIDATKEQVQAQPQYQAVN